MIINSNIDAATDNIADWNNDNKNRLLETKGEVNAITEVLESVVEKLASSIADAERIAEQVATIRAEMQAPDEH